MKEIVYVKYSNERDDRFKIKTVIQQDENGERYVEKHALTEEAREHVRKNAAYAKKLAQCAKGTKFHIAKCTEHEAHIECEYIKGEPFSAILTQKVSERDYDGALEMIREYYAQLQQMATETFVVTEAFEEVFGKVAFEREQKACPVTDIDLIFSNILVNDGIWNVIDLEWTYEFPVPVNFIIYRAILFGGTKIRELAEKYHILSMLGIDKVELMQFEQMDIHFQQWVKGNEIAHWEMAHLQKRMTIDDIVEEKEAEIRRINDDNAALRAENQNYRVQLDSILISRSWRITASLRGFIQKIRSNKYTYLIAKGIKSLLKNGVSVTWQKVKWKINNKLKSKKLANQPLYTKAELEAQKKVKFPKEIKFSILVPLFNTPEQFLGEMIQSVLDQTYANWELCLADGSDAEHDDVGRICMKYVKKDPRVRYQKLEKNMGISGNTNACIDMATGDYIALFDHDDILHPAALHDVMKEICEKNADFLYTDENTFHETPEDAYCPHYKADFAPDTLRCYNYICHFTVFDRNLLEKAGGGFRSEFDGSQDYDMILRLTEQAERIVHIPKILYYWRSHANSVASGITAKPYTLDAAKRALSQHLERVGLKGEVLDSSVPSTYRIAYEIEGEPLISMLIPNKDHVDDLKKCLDSVREKSTYRNWEIIVIENNSTEKATFDYYAEIQKDSRIRVVTWPGGFNFSAINNFGAQYANGEYILLLNNDVEVITPDWLEQMLMFAQREDVGAVGAMLYYPDDTIQHAGVIFGLGGVAGCSHKYYHRGDVGYMYRLTIAQNYSCVTAACHLMSRKVWDEINGLDEGFAVAFNDVDLCMRIRAAGYLVVWTPYAELYHYESKSRGLEDTPEKQRRFQSEIERFQKRWKKELAAGDPYYNPNLTLDREDFSLK